MHLFGPPKFSVSTQGALRFPSLAFGLCSGWLLCSLCCPSFFRLGGSCSRVVVLFVCLVWARLLRRDKTWWQSVPFSAISWSFISSDVVCDFFFVVCHLSSLNFLIQGIDFLNNNKIESPNKSFFSVYVICFFFCIPFGVSDIFLEETFFATAPPFLII